MFFALGIVPPGYALLETIGRKTGKPRRTPVGDGRVAEQFWIVAEHGTKSVYVRNIPSNPRVRVKLRVGLRARTRAGAAALLPDDHARERQRPSSVTNAAAPRPFKNTTPHSPDDLDS